MVINKYFETLQQCFRTFNSDTKNKSYISNISVGNIKSYDRTGYTNLFYINIIRCDGSCTSYLMYHNNSSIADAISSYFNKYVDENDELKYKFTQLNIVSYMLVNNI